MNKDSVLEGIARIVDIGATIPIAPIRFHIAPRRGIEEDFLALQKDWEIVGEVFRTAFASIESQSARRTDGHSKSQSD